MRYIYLDEIRHLSFELRNRALRGKEIDGREHHVLYDDQREPYIKLPDSVQINMIKFGFKKFDSARASYIN